MEFSLQELDKLFQILIKLYTCPVCSKQISDGDFKSVPYRSKFGEKSRHEFPTYIGVCPGCGVGIAFPVISEDQIKALYSEGGYWQTVNLNTSLKGFPVPFGLATVRWKLVEKHLGRSGKVKDLKILDIGAGHGCFGLVANSSHKFSIKEYHAIESDAHMAKHLSIIWKAWGCKTRLKVSKSVEQVDGEYDVVVLSHILEHLVDPGSLIRSARALLSKEGLLFVDVPNQDYLFRDDVFPHILFFSSRSLRLLLEGQNLHIISMGIYGREMYKSPLFINPPFGLKFAGLIVNKASKFLPAKFLVSFYAWYFGISSENAEGTWIRALCQKG